MMKHLLWLTLFVAHALAAAPAAQAQNCNLSFNTQAQLNSYLASGTRCNTPASLSIRGFSRYRDSNGNLVSDGGVSDVSGLQHITAVGQGGVSIIMFELSSLAGLSNIQQIGGALRISNATGASRGLNAFPNLQQVGGEILFQQNASLTSIAGFGRLESAKGIGFFTHPNLGSISGFEALTSTVYLSISQDLPVLRSVSGFNSLRTIGGSNQSGGDILTISGNPLLETIPDFNALISAGFIFISNNPRLQAIVGFNALRNSSTIVIDNNTLLSTISGFNGPLVAAGNVQIIRNAALETLAGFEGLEVAQVSIGLNPRLRAIPSFNNSKLNGQLSVYENAGLEQITGFQSLRAADNIVIDRNPLLATITGFTGSSAPRGLFIRSNPALLSLTPGLAFADYSTLSSLAIENNSSLVGCNVPWLCQYLARGGFIFGISGNAPSCNYAAVLQNCATAPANDLVVTGAQTISGSYRNLTVTGTGVATLNGPLTVAGTLAVQSGGQLATNCQPLTGAGNFFLLNGGRLAVCDPAGLTTTGASGAVQMTGTRSYSPSADYAYTGTQAQATGSGLPATVRNLSSTNPNVLTLSQPVAVTQTLTLADGNFALNGQALTLLSDATGTALVVNSGAGLVTGSTATMQRHLVTTNLGLGYRHYSSPVSGNSLTDLATASFIPSFSAAYNTSATPGQITPFPTVYGYEQARLASATSNYGAFDKGFFSPVTGATPDNFMVGRGYAVNLSGTEKVDFTGTLNSGDYTLALARNAGPTAADAGWQLLGNPYPAPLDWGLVAPTDRPNLDAAIYVVESSSQYGSSYRTSVNGMGSGSSLIGTAQGFFGRVSAGQTSGSVTFRNSQRLTDFATQVAVRRGTSDPRPQLRLTLSGASAALADELVLYAEAGATADADREFDAIKLDNPSGLNLATLAATGQELAIDARPALSAASIPLAVRVPAAGTYHFTVASLSNLPAGTELFLRDALSGTRTRLLAGTRYAAALAGTSAPGRFFLDVSAATALATAAQRGAQVLVYPNPAHDQLTVLRPLGTAPSARLFNGLGQLVRTIALPTAETRVPLRGLAAGVYTLHLTLDGLPLTRRVVVE